MGHFVEHALEHEGVDAVLTERQKPTGVRVLEHVVDPEVRDAVDLVRRAFERDRIEPVLTNFGKTGS